MKRLILVVALASTGGCGLFGSRCEDAETMVFLSQVREVTLECDQYLVTDPVLQPEQAQERFIRNAAMRKRVDLIMAKKVLEGGK